ncbi:unnamed protein product [Mesocestoides corti]|uniref:Uncharacterized protein n=1 Tax=Mesocestoides corti TaxID=53468 RepID=A0A0R3URT3_MESCO|nr:unnamed protein product [Mesocestoides corti]
MDDFCKRVKKYLRDRIQLRRDANPKHHTTFHPPTTHPPIHPSIHRLHLNSRLPSPLVLGHIGGHHIPSAPHDPQHHHTASSHPTFILYTYIRL